MRYLWITSPHVKAEREIIEYIRTLFGTYEGAIVELNQTTQAIFNVRATPALVGIYDCMQGDELLAQDRDGKLIAESFLSEMYDHDSMMIHNQESHRYDNVIRREVEQGQIEAITAFAQALASTDTTLDIMELASDALRSIGMDDDVINTRVAEMEDVIARVVDIGGIKGKG